MEEYDINENTNLIFRIIKYGLRKEKFRLEELLTDLRLKEGEVLFTQNYLVNWKGETSPNHIISAIMPHQFGVYDRNVELRILPTALFQYLDYVEIKTARQAATESKKLAWIAIWISVGIGLMSIALGAFQVYHQICGSAINVSF